MIKEEGYIIYITKDNPVPHTEKVAEVENFGSMIRINGSTHIFYFYTETKEWTILKYDKKIDDVYDVKFEGKVLDFEYKTYLSRDYD